MRILILGGSKSGKSMAGQQLARRLCGGGPLYYWATLEPTDSEDREIVRRHLQERDGWGFQTIERGRALTEGLANLSRDGTVLFDSVTACLACQMFSGEKPDPGGTERMTQELLLVSRAPRHFIAVCDEIWRDGDSYPRWTEEYRRGLALACRRLAAEFEVVCERTAGLPRLWKGVWPDE